MALNQYVLDNRGAVGLGSLDQIGIHVVGFGPGKLGFRV